MYLLQVEFVHFLVLRKLKNRRKASPSSIQFLTMYSEQHNIANHQEKERKKTTSIHDTGLIKSFTNFYYQLVPMNQRIL